MWAYHSECKVRGIRVFGVVETWKRRGKHANSGGLKMLWTIVAILLILWLLGLLGHIGGGLIHLLLVIVLIVVIFNLLSGRRRLL